MPSDIPALFSHYGADYATTMPRFLHNEALYLRLLTLLFSDSSLNALSSALAENDLPAAFAAAHTLKGVTGNLGLTPLYQAVGAITEPLRTGESIDYAPLHAQILHELARAETFCQSLKEALSHE